eukprot:TRINITY_DN32325_c0_g1_i1.p1 TRINITY_DN32325_c0_g1~~TRINITY_DN32325_c0_g1_i1.p1  ORF type:complete len:144 (-),score=21.61 TRINITY_DN32325_c0_g1_i1:33-464(-)
MTALTKAEELFPKESYQELRERLLKQGQRRIKTGDEAFLQHMGLNRQQIQLWRHKDQLRDTSMRQLSRSQTMPVGAMHASPSSSALATVPLRAPPRQGNAADLSSIPRWQTAPAQCEEVQRVRLPTPKGALPPSIFYVGLKFH